MKKKPAKTDAVYKYLVKCAEEWRTCTYGEMGKALNIAPIGLGKNQLCFIRDICHAAGLPLLTVLCVQDHKRSAGQPGHNFIPSDMQTLLMSKKGDESFVRAHKIAAMTFDWNELSWFQVCMQFQKAL